MPVVVSDTGAAVAGTVTAVVLMVAAVVLICYVWRIPRTLKTKCCTQKPQPSQGNFIHCYNIY